MQKIILDVDTGIDDALAILYALGEKDADLIGITTTFGNVEVEKATKNTFSILDLANEKNVPVYQGASHSLSSRSYSRRKAVIQIHGKDGLGDARIEASERAAEKQQAVNFLIESALLYKQNLKIVCIGPLTNLAQAYQKNPQALQQVEEIVVMGGAVTVPGNVTKFAEANIMEDVMAAKIILESDLPLKIVGLDVTMRTILTQKETEIWKSYRTKRSQAVADMATHYFQSYQEQLGLKGCALHDPLAVGIALHSDLGNTLALNLTVELAEPARGWTVGDIKKLSNPNPKTQVCLQVDHEKFLVRFMDAMAKVLRD